MAPDWSFHCQVSLNCAGAKAPAAATVAAATWPDFSDGSLGPDSTDDNIGPDSTDGNLGVALTSQNVIFWALGGPEGPGEPWGGPGGPLGGPGGPRGPYFSF